MKICLKRKIIPENSKKPLEKHQEGFLLGIQWNDKGDFNYIVDFHKEGIHTVDSKDCDVLNL